MVELLSGAVPGEQSWLIKKKKKAILIIYSTELNITTDESFVEKVTSISSGYKLRYFFYCF